MNFHYNVLSDELLDRIKQEQQSRNAAQNWGCSELFWGDNIKIGVTGICASSHVSPELYDEIFNLMKPYFPEYDNLIIQHYIWFRSSGISMHNDGNHRFGATIYLNDSWDMAYGGIFIWQEGNEYRAICPKKNIMVVNDDHTNHMVTTVSDLAPEPRYTLQIWGK